MSGLNQLPTKQPTGNLVPEFESQALRHIGESANGLGSWSPKPSILVRIQVLLPRMSVYGKGLDPKDVVMADS